MSAIRDAPPTEFSVRPVIAYCQRHHIRFVNELKEFIRFPSISSQPEYAKYIEQCADWLAGHLAKIGLQHVEVIRTKHYPIVYAEWRDAPGRPTLLIYGHYDVQPPEPFEEWLTLPFKPTLTRGKIYGRGASDDKGQMFAHLKAIESYISSSGKLPVNVLCLFEGEEEIGSPSLKTFLTRFKDQLKSDVAILSDMPIPSATRPAITESMRGTLSLELEVRGGKRDLHSGLYGGAIHNPVQALCEIIAGLHDETGRVAIPGFYDHVSDLSLKDRAYMKFYGSSDDEIINQVGGTVDYGELNYTLYERTTIRPALTINGISGGYQGNGPKAVIPAYAKAKFNFRLVPDQNPDVIEHEFRRYITYLTPETVRSVVRKQFSAKPAHINRDHPAMRTASIAYQRGFGVKPVFQRSGGTLPVIAMLKDSLGIDTIMMGFALPDDAIHAPNENFHLDNFFKGISTSIHFMEEMGKLHVAALNMLSERDASSAFKYYSGDDP